MDNGGTADALREALGRRGDPAHVEVVENPENLGYGGSLNRALEMATTPFVVTCHSDVRFGRVDYVREMVRLLSENDDVGAVTGLPIIDDPATLTRVEQVYLVAMQMDVDSPDGNHELVTVGFAEGRCDGFRLEAVKTRPACTTAVSAPPARRPRCCPAGSASWVTASARPRVSTTA